MAILSRSRLAQDTLQVIRLILLATLVVGVTGTAAELLLLEHFEEPVQFVPLALLGVSLVVLAWYGISRSRASLRTLQGLMVLFVVAGAVGVILHYRGNVEFELEVTPSMAGWTLFKAAVMGATPALAPGAMVQLGLVGLAYTFRHPRLASPAADNSHAVSIS